jgi:rubredoxin
MAKFRCTICDHIYDEALGDPETGIKAGTLFSDLPDDWVCPVCGAQKNMFVKVAK